MKYEVEYAKSNRSQCRGHCKEKIGFGELRMGSVDDKDDNAVRISWRHFPECTSTKLLDNVLEQVKDCTALPGFNDLKPEDQHQVKKVFRLHEQQKEERKMGEGSPKRNKHQEEEDVEMKSSDMEEKEEEDDDYKMEFNKRDYSKMPDDRAVIEALLEGD